MKKILLATAFIMMMAFGANAQGRDGFFSNYDNGTRNLDGDHTFDIIAPNHGINGYASGNGEEVPVGSGLLVLTALGAGYAVYRKRNK